MSVRVVLDLLDQFTNTRVLILFQNRMWQSRNSEVNVHLVQHWLLVTLHVTCVTANNKCPRSIMFCLVFNVEALAVIRWTCVSCTLLVTCVTANNGSPHSIMFDSFFMKRTCFRSLEHGTFFLHLVESLGRCRQRVSPFYHDLGLDLVDLIENF